MKNKRLLPSLFFTMLKIGLFTFGGGYAMIALLENQLVDKKGWLDKDEFLNVVAITSSAPGSIAVNTSVYIGYRLAGVLGALVATLGVCLPSFTILYLISLFFDGFLSLTPVRYAFHGIRVCVVYLILSAGVRMLKKTEKTPLNAVILCVCTLCLVLFSLLSVSFSTVLYILISGALGVAVWIISVRAEKGVDSEK
ncbi:MAG: chromate transporter [Clostridia bacterium]|nr:chromate transporter [Clostridia bacterium]